MTAPSKKNKKKVGKVFENRNGDVVPSQCDSKHTTVKTRF